MTLQHTYIEFCPHYTLSKMENTWYFIMDLKETLPQGNRPWVWSFYVLT
jgi:hypothetical protein